jgi:4-aminobutyrate aminotransferase-like enzyme
LSPRQETTKRVQQLQRRYQNAISTEQSFEGARGKGLMAESTLGIEITDVTGKKYLDFGETMVVVGHSHPDIVKAVSDHVPTMITGGTAGWSMIEPRVLFAEELKSFLSGRLRDEGRVAFCSSGAEACDYAIGLARQYSKKKVIINFSGAYHGFTGATLAINGIEPQLNTYRIPSRLGTMTAPFPGELALQEGGERAYERFCVDKFKEMFETVTTGNEVAATIFEAVEVMAGLRIPSPSYWKEIFKVCRAQGVLTIADEVFTGLGRTGKFLAIDHYGVEPDIVCLGKGVGGTLPLGVIASRAEVINENLKPNCQSSSAGNQLCCVAAYENLRVIRREKLMQRSATLGKYFLGRLRELKEKHSVVKDVRGIGLILELEPHCKDPATDGAARSRKISDLAFDKGLIIARNGTKKHMLRISPPMEVTRAQIDVFVERMDGVLAAV